MMPAKVRHDYALRCAFWLVLGYASIAFLVINGFLLWELAISSDSFDDDLPFLVAFTLTFMGIAAYGIVVGMGALIAAMLSPVVSIRRRQWYGCCVAGMMIAGCTLLLLFFDLYIGVNSFLLTFVAGFVFALALRVVGLALGWARLWYAPGMCQTCGYDLRQTPIGSGCPECGVVVQ